MKNWLFILLTLMLGLTSCRSEDAPVQKIDQIINIYIDSLGQDMLNSQLAGSYIAASMNDVYGLTDNAPVTFSLKKDAAALSYIEYLAGARRIKIDSAGDAKTYESKIAFLLTAKVTDSTQRLTRDTMTIRYISTPNLFTLSKIWYNGRLEFTKAEGQPNVVKITK